MRHCLRSSVSLETASELALFAGAVEEEEEGLEAIEVEDSIESKAKRPLVGKGPLRFFFFLFSFSFS